MYIKPAKIATIHIILFVFFSVAMLLSIVPRAYAADLTRKEKIACYEKWHLSTKIKQFKQTNCFKAENSLCSIGTIDAGRTPAARCMLPEGATVDSDDDTDSVVIEKQTDPAKDINCNNSNCPLIKKYLDPLIATLSVLVGLAAIIAVVWGGILVTTSAGDPQKANAGKNHIRNAVIGVVAWVFLYAFLQWIVPGGI